MRTQNNYRFGELETRALFALEAAETGLVSSGQLVRMLKISSGRANKLAWQLARKNRLIRIKKGTYFFTPMKSGAKGEWGEEAMALISGMMGSTPYYVSFWSALNFHGLTEQIPLTVQVASTKRMRTFGAFGAKFQFVKVEKLGEWKIEKIAGKEVKVATVEQAIVDCLAHPEYCGGIAEACKAIWEARGKLDYGHLEANAREASSAVARRLGYLLALLKLRPIKMGAPSGLRWLDPSGEKKEIGKSKKWGLLLNLTEKELVQWKEA
jgi:predicted transcriptional regulator of viral defense system